MPRSDLKNPRQVKGSWGHHWPWKQEERLEEAIVKLNETEDVLTQTSKIIFTVKRKCSALFSLNYFQKPVISCASVWSPCIDIKLIIWFFPSPLPSVCSGGFLNSVKCLDQWSYEPTLPFYSLVPFAVRTVRTKLGLCCVYFSFETALDEKSNVLTLLLLWTRNSLSKVQ